MSFTINFTYRIITSRYTFVFLTFKLNVLRLFIVLSSVIRRVVVWLRSILTLDFNFLTIILTDISNNNFTLRFFTFRIWWRVRCWLWYRCRKWCWSWCAQWCWLTSWYRSWLRCWCAQWCWLTCRYACWFRCWCAQWCWLARWYRSWCWSRCAQWCWLARRYWCWLRRWCA